MKFKKLDEPVCTSDPYYDLTLGGYIKPEELLESEEDIEAVKAAIETIESFFEEAEEAGVLVID